MASIGRTHHNKCTHSGCAKRRPHWSMLCKAHRIEAAAEAIASTIAERKKRDAMESEALRLARSIEAFEAKYGIDVYEVLGALEDEAEAEAEALLPPHAPECSYWQDGFEAHCDCGR